VVPAGAIAIDSGGASRSASTTLIGSPLAREIALPASTASASTRLRWRAIFAQHDRSPR
jgi:hypothetical protein